MQTEHLIALAGLDVAFPILTFSVAQAIKKAFKNGHVTGLIAGKLEASDQMATLTSELALKQAELDGARQAIKHLKYVRTLDMTVTPSDVGVMIQVSNIVELAHGTWAPIKGAEPVAKKAKTLHEKLKAINERLTINVNSAAREQAE
jgi:hypothetical protein